MTFMSPNDKTQKHELGHPLLHFNICHIPLILSNYFCSNNGCNIVLQISLLGV
jgi:hypothetical protein